MLRRDEKSQTQALNGTPPGQPLKRRRAGTMTHDYKRNGTTTLFAALNTLDGTVISLWKDRHRHEERLKFLRLIERLFRDIFERRIRRDSFASMAELEQASARYNGHHNSNPRPFIWAASASDALAKVPCARAALARAGR